MAQPKRRWSKQRTRTKRSTWKLKEKTMYKKETMSLALKTVIIMNLKGLIFVKEKKYGTKIEEEYSR